MNLVLNPEILHVIYIILVAHFIGDWLLQFEWMAKEKSKSNYALTAHVLMYSAAIMSIFVTIMDLLPLIIFVGINGILHFMTDYVTSRITSRLWTEGKVRSFFITIGADQLIHFVKLFTTYYYLGMYWT